MRACGADGLSLMWFRVEAPSFVAAVRVEAGEVVATAPILDWILTRRDRSLAWLTRYCVQRHWTLESLPGGD